MEKAPEIRRVTMDPPGETAVPGGAHLGASVQDVTPALREAFGAPSARGALVGSVRYGGPAAGAGLRSGDVILGFDGSPVGDSFALGQMVGQSEPGTMVTLTVWRNRNEVSLMVRLEAPESAAEGSRSDGGETPDGLLIADLDAGARLCLALPSDLTGTFIAAIDSGSPLFAAGLRRWDVILEIDRQPAADAGATDGGTRGTYRGSLLFRVWRDGRVRFVVVNE